MTLGCKHPFCKECIANLLKSDFEEKRKSFLEVGCGICSTKFSLDVFKKYALPSTMKEFEATMKSIPHNPQDPNLKLADFCYGYTAEGLLRHTETGEKFHWVNQIHYDLLGDLIVPHIQEIMREQFKMKEVFLPLNSDLPKHMCNNIFMTPDALTSDKLMLLIQGSGAVRLKHKLTVCLLKKKNSRFFCRAGQWARALCINESLKTGAILEYLTEATKSGFGVIVFKY